MEVKTKEQPKQQENKEKQTWKCPRCNNVNPINVMYCTLCKREQPF